MHTEARERWRAALEAWAIPQRLLDAVADSPYEWPAALYERTRRAEAGIDSPTVEMVDDLIGPGGSVLDVGAGAGRLSIPLARRGHRVTAVERDEGMARVLSDQATEARVDITRVIGSWPQVAGNAGHHDVVTSAHVVYDVASIGSFVEAMHRAARRAVAVEMTPRHPWAGLSRYFLSLHGLERPSHPTVDDFAAVVEEVVGVTPNRRPWTAPPGLRFADLGELLAFYRRRLLVPPERSIEAAGLIEPDVERTDDGWLVLGPVERQVVTVWWSTR
ncbi:MAG TPA: methyltransferase domain-containing protein [Acidimicrobiia bacterium]|nr:methyltransferase domain-containing protein [Acidimicrobiia bacterium]